MKKYLFFYENFSAGIHTAYFDKVIGAWKR